jgi:hypothetical protein
MHPIIKTVLAIIIGIVISMCVVVLTETVAERYFPAHSLNPTIPEREEMIRTAPLIAMLIFLLGHGLSSFFGSYIAARIAPDTKKFMAGITVAFVLLLGGIVLFVSIQHPLWLALGTCISYLVFSILAVKIASRRL